MGQRAVMLTGDSAWWGVLTDPLFWAANQEALTAHGVRRVKPATWLRRTSSGSPNFSPDGIGAFVLVREGDDQPGTTDVVVAVSSLSTTLARSWQAEVVSGSPISLEAWLAREASRDAASAAQRWRCDVEVSRWDRQSWIDRVTLVVGRGRVLVDHVADRLGLAPGTLVVPEGRPRPDGPPVVVALLERLAEDLDALEVQDVSSRRLLHLEAARSVLRDPADDFALPPLARQLADRLSVLGDAMVRGVAGVDVVGDLDRLRRPVFAVEQPSADAAVPVGLASGMAMSIFDRLATGAGGPALPSAPVPTTRDRGLSEMSARRALGELARRVRSPRRGAEVSR